MQRRLLLLVLLAPWPMLAVAAPLPTKELAQLKRDAQRACKAGDWSAAEEAIAGLAKDDTKKTVDVLLKLVAKHEHAAVYRAVRDGLAGMNSGEALARICEKAKKASPLAAHLVVLDACALRDDPATAGALADALKTRSPQALRAAIQAVTQRKLLNAIGALIELLATLEADDPDGLAAHSTREALVTITSERKHTAADWRGFWAEKGDGFRPKTGAPPPPDPLTTRTRPTFFGTTVVSNKVVFLVDVSTSMERQDPGEDDAPERTTTGSQPGRGGSSGTGDAVGEGETGGPAAKDPTSGSRVRIVRARFQLKKAIAALPTRAQFTVIAYSGYLEDARSVGAGFRFPSSVPQTLPLPDVIEGVPWLRVWKPKLTQAGDTSKGSALEFVDRLQPKGSTFTLRALKVALSVPGVETIVLLSDGAPTEIHGFQAKKLLTAGEMLTEVKTLNRLKRVRIDTFGVGIEDEVDFLEFLRDLAKQNGGAFTRVR